MENKDHKIYNARLVYIKHEEYEQMRPYKETDYYTREKLGSEVLPYNDVLLNLAKLKGRVVGKSTDSRIVEATKTGVLFSGSGDSIEKNIDERILYWSKLGMYPEGSEADEGPDGEITWHVDSSKYYQNSTWRLNLEDESDETLENIRMVSAGVVYALSTKHLNLHENSPEDYIAFEVPFVASDIDEWFGLYKEDKVHTIYLRVADILECPDNEELLIEVFRSEAYDYGYYY